jgi:hypothetical protein
MLRIWDSRLVEVVKGDQCKGLERTREFHWSRSSRRKEAQIPLQTRGVRVQSEPPYVGCYHFSDALSSHKGYPGCQGVSSLASLPNQPPLPTANLK